MNLIMGRMALSYRLIYRRFQIVDILNCFFLRTCTFLTYVVIYVANFVVQEVYEVTIYFVYVGINKVVIRRELLENGSTVEFFARSEEKKTL